MIKNRLEKILSNDTLGKVMVKGFETPVIQIPLFVASFITAMAALGIAEDLDEATKDIQIRLAHRLHKEPPYFPKRPHK